MAALRRLEELLALPGPAAAAAALNELRSVLLPVECVACGTPDASLCLPCLAAFRQATLRPFDASERAAMLPRHEEADHLPLPVTAAGRYGAELARVMLAYKNHGHTDLTGILAEAMARALYSARSSAAHSGHLAVVPVPGSFRGRTRRGYDPLELILAKIERRGLLPAGTGIHRSLRFRPAAAAAGVLGRSRGGQKTLRARARRRNVHGTMTARPGTLQGATVLVADDVLTTGATLAEAVRALRGAGAHVAGAVVIAAVRAPS
ncbi:ComF family protein [Arthrobacter sp. BL-252-APC-1A]|uniref:ComF family protein n=1 Tax=Arthrobacter sp. BL-252-APC-1A TaxID=2606622 RepID=UPI0012B41300|nr:phosphoribosyltransferase family protein [Arthrobacter sp. BL-252-APC-1A]MSR98205.1 ComF family protein [Arthrobacter sp. BL-252-APC-1A]